VLALTVAILLTLLSKSYPTPLLLMLATWQQSRTLRLNLCPPGKHQWAAIKIRTKV
jgi:hypothetical protein